jgi:hypothetical protein
LEQIVEVGDRQFARWNRLENGQQFQRIEQVVQQQFEGLRLIRTVQRETLGLCNGIFFDVPDSDLLRFPGDKKV